MQLIKKLGSSNPSILKDEINLTLTENREYTWLIGNYGLLKSLRLDGIISKEGSARIYLEHDDNTYLIFDNSRWGAVTGLVVDASLENKFLVSMFFNK